MTCKQYFPKGVLSVLGLAFCLDFGGTRLGATYIHGNNQRQRNRRNRSGGAQCYSYT